MHTYKECLRYALTHRIAFRAPQLHPFNPLLSLRVTWAAESDAARERAAHALYALYALGWAELYLTGRDPLAALDWNEFALRGSSAQRRGVSRS